MKNLLPGIQKFHRNEFPARRQRFEELSGGQQPSTLFITCSDSRIVPHLITQTEPGDLFVLRNAGNFVPPYGSESSGEAATIEYAVKALRVSQIVVCGHSHCGAVTAVLRPELVRELPAVEKWLVHADKPRLEIAQRKLAEGGGDELTTAIQANVLVQLEHLRSYPFIAEAESAGTLELYGCFYRFEAGEIFAFDGAGDRFVSVVNENSSSIA